MPRFLMSRRAFQSTAAALVLSLPAAAFGQILRPYETFDPSKAQSLPTSPLAIESGGKMQHFTVELATTKAQHDTGLMHRKTLAADHGMLFDFHHEQQVSFWMRNTFIPLDMLFIRSSGVIIAISPNTVPHSETAIGPAQPVQAVLEVPGGTTERFGIKVGDIAHHAIFNNAVNS